MGQINQLTRKTMAGLGLRPPVIEVPTQGYELNDVTIINPGVERKVVQKLIVKGSAISSISDDGHETGRPSGAGQYAGSFVLPGLIDMHVHYTIFPSRLIPSTFDTSEYVGLLFLAYGTTTVRDVGNFDLIWRTRRRINDGAFPAPRMYCCGPIIDGDPPRMRDMSWVVRTREEGRAAVDRLATMGADFIKVYDNLTPESLAGIREAANNHGLDVVGHLPFKVTFAEAHINDLQHVWGVQLPELRPGLDFNNPDDFAHYMASWREIDDTRMDEIVRISVDQSVTHTPTIVVQKNLVRDASRDEEALLMPRFFRDVLWSPDYGIKYIGGHSKEELAKVSDSIEKVKESVGRLHSAGVRIMAGTDTPGSPVTLPGVSLQEEIGLLAESGLTLEEAWAAGTHVAGEWLGVPMLGTLQEGAPADLLVFRQDPTKNLDAFSTLEAVSANGRLYTRDVLDDGLASHQEYFKGRLYDSVTMAAARSAIKKLG